MSLTCERLLVSSRSLSLCGGPATDECLAGSGRDAQGPEVQPGEQGRAPWCPSLQAAFRIGSYKRFFSPFPSGF